MLRRISKRKEKMRLVVRRETIKLLASEQLVLVIGGITTANETETTGYECRPTVTCLCGDIKA